MPMMLVEPGTTVPITGMASDRARIKTATKAKIGCAPVHSMSAWKNDAICPFVRGGS
jgi:hypothetical protein